MKILILCLLTARTCLGQEQYNDTITEYLEKHPEINIANDEELAIAAKNLAANEDKINAQNEKYSKGEANYRQILFIPEQFFFNLLHSLNYTFFYLGKAQVILEKKVRISGIF